MKTITIRKLFIAAACLSIISGPLTVAQTNSSFDLQTPAAETPKTAAEKLDSLEARHKSAFATLTTHLNRLPKESSILGSKELFTMVDESTREMKNIRTGCDSLMNSLRSEAKTVESSSSFSDDQKKELVEAAESMAKDCRTLSAAIDLAIKRLDAAYTIFPKWNRVHKSYRNLQGEAKASEVVKGHVDEYLKSFTPDTSAAEDTAKSSDAFEKESE